MTFSSKKSFLSLIDLVPYSQRRVWSKNRDLESKSDDKKKVSYWQVLSDLILLTMYLNFIQCFNQSKLL